MPIRPLKRINVFREVIALMAAQTTTITQIWNFLTFTTPPSSSANMDMGIFTTPNQVGFNGDRGTFTTPTP